MNLYKINKLNIYTTEPLQGTAGSHGENRTHVRGRGFYIIV